MTTKTRGGDDNGGTMCRRRTLPFDKWVVVVQITRTAATGGSTGVKTVSPGRNIRIARARAYFVILRVVRTTRRGIRRHRDRCRLWWNVFHSTVLRPSARILFPPFRSRSWRLRVVRCAISRVPDSVFVYLISPVFDFESIILYSRPDEKRFFSPFPPHTHTNLFHYKNGVITIFSPDGVSRVKSPVIRPTRKGTIDRNSHSRRVMNADRYRG